MSKYSYQQELLDLGFTSIKDHGAEKSQCVLCYKVLSNEIEEKTFEKKKLKSHLETKHLQHIKRIASFFSSEKRN